MAKFNMPEIYFMISRTATVIQLANPTMIVCAKGAQIKENVTPQMVHKSLKTSPVIIL